MKKQKLSASKLQLNKKNIGLLTIDANTKGLVNGGEDYSRGGDLCNTQHPPTGGPIYKPSARCTPTYTCGGYCW